MISWLVEGACLVVVEESGESVPEVVMAPS